MHDVTADIDIFSAAKTGIGLRKRKSASLLEQTLGRHIQDAVLDNRFQDGSDHVT